MSTQPTAGAMRGLYATPSKMQGRSMAGEAHQSTILRHGGGECITVLTVGIDQLAHEAKVTIYTDALNTYEQTQADLAELREALSDMVRCVEIYVQPKGNDWPCNEDVKKARAVLARHS